MRGKVKFKKSILIALLFFLTSSINISAQDYTVTPLSDLLSTYTTNYTDFLKEIESKVLDQSKKLFICANKLSELKSEFTSKRTLEYKLKSVKRARRQSCKGTKVRGVTECEPLLVKVPNDNMYTKGEWITREGSDKINIEILDDFSVNLKMTATSTRLNKALVYIIFKYKPDLILEIVEKEANELSNLIIKNSAI